DAPNKLYQIVFKIEYEDIKNRSYSSTKNIGVLISVDKPVLIISNYSLDKENVIPGDSFNLKLNVKNIGGFDANDIKITIKNVENTNSLSPFSIISKGNTIYIKEIKVNEESSVDLGLKLSDDAQDNKVYNLVVSVSYKDVTSKDYSKDETLSIYVSKKEKIDEPNLILKSISFEPKILNPGTSFRLNIKILNNGGSTAKNSKLEFTGVGASTDLSPFSFVDSGSLIYLGDIKSGEEKNAQVNLNISKDAKEGVYNISIKLTYENSEKYSETQKIGVVIQKSEPQRNVNVVLSSYLVTPEISSPGGTVEIDYVISNISKESAYNVTHKIEKVENSNSLYPFSPISTSNINTTRLIQGYSSVSSKFKFIISGETESGNYNLVFTITYEDSSGNTYSNTSTIGVVVLRKPIISIFNLIYPDKVKTNEKFTLSCEIANLGKFSINGVLITLEGSPIKGVDKFIGMLDPGISDTYEAELSFDKVNVYNMTLKVQYVDDSNSLHYEKRDIKIEVIEESKEPTNTTNTQKLSFWQRLWRFILSLFGLGK
ncbi:MAG: COG1361 S-layer family protein, partial [Caldisericia bacterium]